MWYYFHTYQFSIFSTLKPVIQGFFCGISRQPTQMDFPKYWVISKNSLSYGKIFGIICKISKDFVKNVELWRKLALSYGKISLTFFKIRKKPCRNIKVLKIGPRPHCKTLLSKYAIKICHTENVCCKITPTHYKQLENTQKTDKNLYSRKFVEH